MCCLIAAAGVLMLGWPAGLGARHRSRNAHEDTYSRYSNTLMSNSAQIGGACVQFAGGLKAGPKGDLLLHLKRIRTPSGVVFRNGSKTVLYYPDGVTLWCFAAVGECSPTPRGFWPDDIPDFVKGIRAEAGYIRDLHFHPLEIDLAEEGTTPRLMGHISWSYTYVIETKGVRLTDTLVVYLYSRDGVRRWHFYVDLAGRTTP